MKELGKRAKAASKETAILTREKKDEVLNLCGEALLENMEYILSENQRDMEEAEKNSMPDHMRDRLLLTEARVKDMATGLFEIAKLEDPVGEIISKNQRPNGLVIEKKRVPMGVIGIIYEARPNVTSDAFGLCFKTGNAVILKGGSDAITSNKAIVKVLRGALTKAGVTEDALQLIEDTSRETAKEFMRLNEYVDVLIPRGGAGLIKTVVENSTVPVIETGTGNCHVYVDEDADLDMALKIVENAKTQRLSVCNTCESLVIGSAVLSEAMAKIGPMLSDHEIEMRCDERALGAAREACKDKPYAKINTASEDDWGTEYLDKIISIKVVDSSDEAINHINKYNTGHSETIVTSNEETAEKFLERVDAAAVYVNASTRFTDGFEFGFGGEIGISTQKLHARGPMGLEALTSYKYVIRGEGQVRA